MKREAKLFEPIQFGPYELKNRIAMASLTRMRADYDLGIPTDLHVEHYRQRAGAGVIFTEASQISKLGEAFPGSCGIYTKEQIKGWKKVTDAVHAEGGRIFIQLWHAGRATHPELNGGKVPVAPSPVRIRGFAHTPKGKFPYPEPRSLTIDEIKEIQQEFRQASINAMEAGFDGVELHGANGYLVHQFINDFSNFRTDQYGGIPENRCRFALECIDELIDVWGADRVGMKLSPVGRFNDMLDGHPQKTYRYLIEQLNERNVLYIQMMEPAGRVKEPCGENRPYGCEQIEFVAGFFRRLFKGIYIANNNFNYELAEEIVRENDADMVSFGRDFISNPDLVYRLQHDLPFTPYDVNTFYFGGDKGYTDYPFYNAS